jgi:hypothetical protein
LLLEDSWEWIEYPNWMPHLQERGKYCGLH